VAHADQSRVLEEARREATARGEQRVHAEDVEAALRRLLPRTADAAGNLTFFPERDERVAISALDLESFRSFGLSWRILQVMLDGGVLHLDPEPDADAAEPLAEGLTGFALLVLRIGGDFAREGQLTPFVRASDLSRADYEIRRLAEPAAEPSAAPGEGGDGSVTGETDEGKAGGNETVETPAPVHQPVRSPERRAELDRRYCDAWGIAPDDPALPTEYAIRAAGVFSYGEALEHFETALALDPDYLDAHIGYGLLLLRVGREADAIPHFEKLIGSGRPFEPMAHTHLGRILGTLGRRDEAFAHFRAAVEINPRNADTRFNLGLAHYQQRRYQEAVVELQEAVELDPSHALAHLRLGGALGKLGRHEEALAVYQKLLGINHRDPVALYEIGVTFQILENQRQARRAFERALAQAKKSYRYRDLQKRIEERLAEL